MHQPFPFDDDDEDLSPDAGFALRHALRHALAREVGARRRRVRAPAANSRHNPALHAMLDGDDARIASYPRHFRQVA